MTLGIRAAAISPERRSERKSFSASTRSHATLSPAAAAWYDKLFRSLFDSPQWKDYATRNSLGGALLTGQSLMGYWVREREKHVRWKMAIELMKPQ